MRRLLILVVLAFAFAPLGAHASPNSCTAYTTGAELTPWHCSFLAHGPTSFTYVSASNWSVRRFVKDDQWQTLASQAAITDVAGQGTAPTVDGDLVEIVIWPSYVTKPDGSLFVYRDGFITASG